jgi:hypothetical protein
MRLIPLTLLILLAAAAPASAAKPFFLGTGGNPGVAVDAAGTAHVAWWVESATAPDAVHYCQVPRRARRCAVLRTLPAPGLRRIPLSDVQVLLPRPGTVLIVAPSVNGPSALFSSADGGATFATRPMAELGNIADAQYGPGDSLSLAPAQFGAYGQFGLDGSGLAWPVSLADASEAMDPTLVLHEGRPVVMFGGTAGFKTFAWTGAGSPNDQAMWAPGPTLPYEAFEPSAASGPSGTFVAFVRRESPGGVLVRRFTPERFGRARRITGDTFATPSLVQWPRGKLTVLFEVDDALYRRNKSKGRRWSRAKRLFRGNDPYGLQAATGPRGGWLVWDGEPLVTTGHPIRMARLPRR